MNRNRLVIKNTIWEYGYYFVIVIIGLFAPKLIIEEFGSSVNGLSTTITQILNIILLLEAGATTAAVYTLYEPAAKKDFPLVAEKLYSSTAYFHRLAYLFLIITIAVAGVSAFVIDTEIEWYFVFIAFVALGAKSFIDLYFTSKYRILFTAMQEKFYISIATLVEQLVYYLLVFLSIFFHWHFVFLFSFLFIGCVARIFVMDYFFNQNYGIIKQYNRNGVAAFIPGRNYSLANEVAHSVMSTSAPLIVSFVYGLKEASVVAVYSLVLSAASLVTTPIYTSFAPSFANLIQSESNEKINKIFNKFQYIFISINTILSCTIICSIVPFVNLYIGNQNDINYLNPTLAFVLVVTNVFSALRIPYNIIVSSCGLFKETWEQPVYTAVGTIVLSALLSILDYPLVFCGPAIFYFINYLYQLVRLQKFVSFIDAGMSLKVSFLSVCVFLVFAITNKVLDYVEMSFFNWIYLVLSVLFASIILWISLSAIFIKPMLVETLFYIKRIIFKSSK